MELRAADKESRDHYKLGVPKSCDEEDGYES